MIWTLGQAVKLLGEHVEGGSCDRTLILKRINEAMELLLDQADWKDTVRRIRCKTFKSCLALPREIEKVISVNIDNRATQTFSQFYDYLEGGPERTDCTCNRWTKALEDLGQKSATFNPIPQDCDDYVLFAMSTEQADTSLSLQVYGKGPLSQEVVAGGQFGESIPINRWKGGVEGVIDGAVPITKGTLTFNDIASIVKPITESHISLYAWNTRLDDFTMYYLAKFHPEETNPGYRRYKVLGADLVNGQCITMAVKIAFYPLVRDDEPLQIQSIPALKEMILSLDASVRDAVELSAAHQLTAVNYLVNQRRNAQANDPTVNVQYHGFGLGSVLTIR